MRRGCCVWRCPAPWRTMDLSSTVDLEVPIEKGPGTMHTQSSIVHARELRRHDLLEDAARHRLAAAVAGANQRRVLPVRSWVGAIGDILRSLAQARRHRPLETADTVRAA